ncbi:YtfJ family protein [Thaumasiovibrio sp. DFM-14]|uniref:YtfJ family protein n=1 Tax=Thaumasiovibrio sp. DFM-14 TaxID=3384792 RepID=UPI0039A3D5A4
MKLKTLTFAFTALLSTTTFATNISLGETLPSVTVSAHGEILFNDDTLSYQAWDTEQLSGKVRVIQAIAGRSAAKEMNSALMDAITAADFPAEQYQTTTIINQNDALWGTGGFVKSSAESSKQEFSWSSMVLDADGAVQNAWDLSEKNSAIIVIDQIGKVLYFQEGKLSNEEIEQVVSLISNTLY